MSDILRREALEQGVENFLDSVNEYGHFFARSAILREPGSLLTQTPRIPGLDGRKMSKSYGNFISLSESDESIRVKSRAMITDPARKRRTDPGNPEVLPRVRTGTNYSLPPETLKMVGRRLP